MPKKSNSREDTKFTVEQQNPNFKPKRGFNSFQCNDCGWRYNSKKETPRCGNCGKTNSTLLSRPLTDVHKENVKPVDNVQQEQIQPAQPQTLIKTGYTPLLLEPEIVVDINKAVKQGYGNSPEDIVKTSLESFFKSQALGGNMLNTNGNPLDPKTLEMMKVIQEYNNQNGGKPSNMMDKILDFQLTAQLMKIMNGGNDDRLEQFMRDQKERELRDQFSKQIQDMNSSNQNAINEVKRTIELSNANGKQLSASDALLQLQTIFSNNQQNQQKMMQDYQMQIEKIRGDAELAKSQLLTTQLSSIQQQIQNQHTNQFTPNGMALTTQIGSLKDTITAVKEVGSMFAPKEETGIEQAGKILGQAIEQINPTVLQPIGAAIANKIASGNNNQPSYAAPSQETFQEEPNEPNQSSLVSISTGD